MKLVTVKLYGHLGQRFGRIHRFAIATPAEAIRALKANFRDFGQHLLDHNAPGYRIITDMGERSAEQLAEPVGGRSIKIVPLVAGAGPGVQFIIGATLVALDQVFLHTGYMTQIGIAMMVGGASQMLFGPPKQPNQNSGGANNPSYAFSGPVNTTSQGNPVPVCYGRLMVGSQVVSGGMYVAQI